MASVQMDHTKMLERINNLEAAAKLILQECHKTKDQLVGIYPPAARKGKFTAEDAARTRVKMRMKAFGHT